jgi:hypothetical protein
MSEYTPTTDEVRYAYGRTADYPDAFDPWLAEVKREARREAFLAVLHVVNSVRDIAAVNRLRKADQADE